MVGLAYLGEFPSEMALRQAVLIAPLALLVGAHRGFYKPVSVYATMKSFYNCAYMLAISAAFLMFFTFYTKTTAEFSRVVFTGGCFISFIFILAARRATMYLISRRFGYSLQNTLIIHADGPSLQMKDAFHINAREFMLAPDASDPTNLDRLGRYMHNMDRVIVSCPPDDRDLWAPLLRAAGIQGEFVSDSLRRMGALRLQNDDIFSTIVVSVKPLGLEARMFKRVMDLAVSSAALLLLSPVMAAIALLIWLEDGSPILFKQQRMGQSNRLFWIYKFRSMSSERCDEEGRLSASRSDDRTTKIGKLIRRTSIDELPQLFNVWRGDMSLVGPRPHALASQAGAKLFWEVDGRYWNRHVLKPGLTGLAQIRGHRGATECEKDLTDRLQADLEYIANWSPWLDLKVILRTFGVMIHHRAY